MKAVALVRCSTSHQTVEQQTLAIKAYAAVPFNKLDGVEIQFVEEKAVRGKADRRPIFEAVLARCRKGEVQILIVWAMDRLGRSLARVIGVMDELHAKGVRVVALKENIDYATAAGRVQVALLAAFAQFELERGQERREAKRELRKAQGLPLTLHGWKWQPSDLEALQELLKVHTLREIERGKMLKVFNQRGVAGQPSARAMGRALKGKAIGSLEPVASQTA